MTDLDDPKAPQQTGAPSGVSRRNLIVGAGVAAGVVVGGAGGAAITAAATSASTTNAVYPFYGEHQAGITTPAQDRLHFAAFDVSANTTRAELIQLLKDWTDAAAKMTQGLDVGDTGATDGSALAPPDDTGEAVGLGASGLTITFGFGPTLFTDSTGADRFGIASRTPALLAPLPRFTGDALVPADGGGDLCIQACADDPQVAVHAIRNLSRIAFGRAAIRWSQLGFGRTSSTSTSQVTPRNLFGFKDGTANVKAEDSSEVEKQVWTQKGDDVAWMAGGTFLVSRKIRMIIESWDRQQLQEQQNTIGRSKGEGAPLSGGTEYSDIVLSAKSSDGTPAIPANAHVRLAHPTVNKGMRLLRRGYNFVDGNDDLGRLNAGLFFISFQRSPEQFIQIQKSLARDGLNEYIKHVSSGIFAVPPGTAQGGYVGSGLFA